MWWKTLLVLGAALFLALAITPRTLDISIFDHYLVIRPRHLALIGSSFVLVLLLALRLRVHH